MSLQRAAAGDEHRARAVGLEREARRRVLEQRAVGVVERREEHGLAALRGGGPGWDLEPWRADGRSLTWTVERSFVRIE